MIRARTGSALRRRVRALFSHAARVAPSDFERGCRSLIIKLKVCARGCFPPAVLPTAFGDSGHIAILEYAGDEMRRHVGPRRAESVGAYLRRTRVIALIALLTVAGAIVSDVLERTFWVRHALLTSLAASVVVVVLSVAVIDAVLERRRRERWSVLAQYVMLELVRNARLIWTGVLEHAGLLGPGRRSTGVRRGQWPPRPGYAAADCCSPRGRRRRCAPA